MLIDLIQTLSNLPSEAILCMEYLTCLVTIICMARFFGKGGLFAYIVLAIIIGNIQVLKTASFSFLNFHVALGTIVFSSTFIVTDILSEFYGASEARKAVWLGFVATLFVTVIMFLTIGIKPVDSTMEAHRAIESIFLPLPSLFFASLISYLICQHLDIWIFQGIRRMTNGKYLGLRTVISSAASSLLDNIIFSTLAFLVFAPHPVSIKELVYTYILGTYIFRIAIVILQTPTIYLIRSMRTN